MAKYNNKKYVKIRLDLLDANIHAEKQSEALHTYEKLCVNQIVYCEALVVFVLAPCGTRLDNDATLIVGAPQLVSVPHI